MLNLTIVIIIITALSSLAAFNRQDLQSKFMFNSYQVYHRKEYYRLLSHTLVHGDLFHLFVNMLVLFSFGKVVEYGFGELFGGKGFIYFLVLYIGGAVVASLPGLFRHKDNPGYNAVGASGAVSAVLFSAIIWAPTSSIYLMFIPIPIPAFIFGPLYIAYEIYMDRRGGTRIAHDAHYWGAIYGIVFTLISEPRLFGYFINQIFG